MGTGRLTCQLYAHEISQEVMQHNDSRTACVYLEQRACREVIDDRRGLLLREPRHPLPQSDDAHLRNGFILPEDCQRGIETPISGVHLLKAQLKGVLEAVMEVLRSAGTQRVYVETPQPVLGRL